MIETLLLVLVAPLALFPRPGSFPILLAIPAWWVWRRARHAPGFDKHFVPPTPLDGCIVLLLIMVLVSVFATYDVAVSLPKIAGVIYGVGVYYAAVNACRQPRPGPGWAAVGAFLLAGAGVAGLALFGTIWPVKFGLLDAVLARLPRILSGLPGAEGGINSAEVAGSLLWVAPSALALAVALLGRAAALRARLGKLATGLILLGVVGVALFTLGVFLLAQSRTGLVGFGLAALALALAGVARRRAVAWAGLAVIVGIGLLLAAVTAIIGPERALQLSVGGDPVTGSIYTLDSRVEFWVRGIQGIRDFAYTGMGMNTFRVLIHALYPLGLTAPGTDIGHAHNMWLQAALDLGVPGLIAYLGLWLGAGVMLAGLWRAADSVPGEVWPASFGRALAAGLGSGLLAHLVFGLTDAVALGAKPGVVWWLMLGLIAGLFRQAQALTRN